MLTLSRNGIIEITILSQNCVYHFRSGHIISVKYHLNIIITLIYILINK